MTANGRAALSLEDARGKQVSDARLDYLLRQEHRLAVPRPEALRAGERDAELRPDGRRHRRSTPAAEHGADKAQFGSTRRARWFGRS